MECQHEWRAKKELAYWPMADHPMLSGPSPTLRLSALILCALIAFAVVGSFISEIEIVARGTGKIVPVGSVRQVQSQIDGRVTEIAIRDGERVQQGQLLFALDQTDQKAEAEQVKNDIERLNATAAKLKAELTALDAFDPIDEKFLPFAIDEFRQADLPEERRLSTHRLLVAELKNLSASIAELDANIASARADQQVAVARLEKNNVLLALEQKLFDAATALQANGNLSQSEFAKKTQTYEELRREKLVQERDGLVKALRLQELNAVRQSKLAFTRQDWTSALDSTERNLAELRTRLSVVTRNLAYSTITAPVSGKIEELKIKTVGGRVTAGDALAKIVPIGEAFEFEGQLSTAEAAFIEKGQPVYLKFDAYPAERYALGNGTVRDISGDTVTKSDKTWAYVFRVTLSATALNTLNGSIPLSPGMTATADIVTGKRRLISYLFEPIERSIMNGVRER